MLGHPLALVNTVGYGRGMDDRLNHQHWLDAGLAQLAESGPDSLRIMPIAQRLGVTKGSFYWHFRDLSDYRAALLAEWERAHTQQVIDHVEAAGGDAPAKLRRLMGITVSSDGRLAQAVRHWAHGDPLVARALKRVDRKRLAYVSGLLSALGWPPADAQTLARWAYCGLLGHFSLQGEALSERQVDLILGTFLPRLSPRPAPDRNPAPGPATPARPSTASAPSPRRGPGRRGRAHRSPR